MISEGKRLRIASKAADAVLAAAAAATMAQGPRDFVSFGAIQSPGVVRGQEEGRKRGEADRNLDSGRVSHSARNKKMKTFREFLEVIYELEESSMGERSRGRATLARGRGADMTRQERTTAAIAKKAGIKGTGKYSTKDLRAKAKDYTTYDSEDELDDIGSTEQDHFIRTHSSPRKAAKSERLISKMKSVTRPIIGRPGITGRTTAHKTPPSSESVRRVKDLKKNMTKAGANKRGRVHTVDIMHRDSQVVKNDPDQQMERGRNFIAAVKDTPNQLKKAGAKKGEAVIGRPSAVMPSEDRKKGREKRAKLYKKAFGKRSTERSAKTGLMVGKAD